VQNTKEPVVDTVLQFLERINQHDADKLAELMTEDHIFIDSLGQSVRGRENMRSGWRSGADGSPINLPAGRAFKIHWRFLRSLRFSPDNIS
jgi:ketosteroid isomerase-like protein